MQASQRKVVFNGLSGSHIDRVIELKLQLRGRLRNYRDDQQLRALTALAEDPSLVPSTWMEAHNRSRASDALFWPQRVLHTGVVLTYRKTKHSNLKFGNPYLSPTF